MKLSIKNRIYLSFSLLVSLFVINAVITFITIDYNKKLSKHIAEVIDPSLQAMENLHDMLVQSKMYTTNWVFLRANQDDKNALLKLHSTHYPLLKSQLNSCVVQWKNKNWVDSLQKIMIGFEELQFLEKNIASALNKFEDYDDPVKKFGAEEQLESMVLPITTELMTSLDRIVGFAENLKAKENESLNASSSQLRMLIGLLVITIIMIGIFLSVYMSRKIISPINMIRNIINDLGKGIIQKVNHKASRDEIGEMVISVNNLSENLQMSASFAQEIGNRNFNIPFKPLSEQDALGKALITMRNNLKSSDERLNEAQHIAHLGSWEIDIMNNTNSWSDEVYKIYGIGKGDMPPTKESFLSFMHPDDLDFANQTVANAFNTLTDSSFSYRFIRKDGITRHGYTEWKFEFDEKQNPVRLYGITIDITERKQAEENLKQIENRFRDIFNAAPESIVILDINTGRFTEFNENALRLLNYSAEEMKMKGPADVSPPFQPDGSPSEEKAREQIMRAVKGEKVVFEWVIVDRNGKEKFCEVRLATVFHANGPQIITNFSDISERKKAEEVLRSSNAELKKSNNELDKFVYSVSHDLRAPLLSMLGVVEISEDESTSAFITKNLGMLKGSIKKLDGFIKDILDYSRNTRLELQKEDINFKEIIEDITHNMKFIGIENRKVEIRTEINYREHFMSDKGRINVVLNNLIANAVRYQNPDTDNPFVNVKIDMSDTETHIKIEDNGIGISKENQEKIFEMFYRVSESSVGSGLGLYIVRETVNKLHGSIEVESKPGVGTIFELSIPNMFYQ